MQDIIDRFINKVVSNGKAEIMALRVKPHFFQVTIGDCVCEMPKLDTNNIESVIEHFLQPAIDESNRCDLQLLMRCTHDTDDIVAVEFSVTKKKN